MLALSVAICWVLLRRGPRRLVVVFLLGTAVPVLSLYLIYKGVYWLFDQHPVQTGPAR